MNKRKDDQKMQKREDKKEIKAIRNLTMLLKIEEEIPAWCKRSASSRLMIV